MENKICQNCEDKKATFIYKTATRDVNYICKTCLVWRVNKGWTDSMLEIKASNFNVRRYNLPLDQVYKLASTDCLGLDNYTACDNCNRVINNTATLENGQGKQYTVGLDCATTLQLCNASDIFKILEQEAKFRKITKLQSDIKKWKAENKYSVIKQGNAVYLYNAIVTEWKSFWKVQTNLDRYTKYYQQYE